MWVVGEGGPNILTLIIHSQLDLVVWCFGVKCAPSFLSFLFVVYPFHSSVTLLWLWLKFSAKIYASLSASGGVVTSLFCNYIDDLLSVMIHPFRCKALHSCACLHVKNSTDVCGFTHTLKWEIHAFKQIFFLIPFQYSHLAFPSRSGENHFKLFFIL